MKWTKRSMYENRTYVRKLNNHHKNITFDSFFPIVASCVLQKNKFIQILVLNHIIYIDYKLKKFTFCSVSSMFLVVKLP
jgi:hypothetical protein